MDTIDPTGATPPPSTIEDITDNDSKTNGINGHSSRLRSLELVDRCVDELRELSVVVVGAGISGIIAGVLLPAKVPGIKLTIYEKNDDVSGTWHENTYPGVRCDIPAHVYQTSFEPNTQWTEEFATGPEIKAYWQHIARKYGVHDSLKLAHRVDRLDWDDAASVWRVRVTDLRLNATFTRAADFVLTAAGRFNAWRLPDYPGLADYAGHLRHTSDWDAGFDPAGKRVAVIGNGASGVQVATSLQPVVARLDHYARSPTWISASFSGDATAAAARPIPVELRQRFREDPAAYARWRKALEDKYWRGFDGWLRGSPANAALRASTEEYMRRHAARRPDLLEHLLPTYPPLCRRLTPGPGYLEAVTAANAEYIRAPIQEFTRTGIRTADGRHREVDAVLCATSANVDAVPPFPVTARGRDLASAWSPGGDPGFPLTYLGAAAPGFPNLLFVFGPNCGRAGSIPLSIEAQVTFYARVQRKAAREGVRAMAPSRRAADDFAEYCGALFRTTVLSEGCRSWYNGGAPGGFVHGLWPGSGAHWAMVLSEPRWEDWEYEYWHESGNRLLWYFGRGVSKRESDPEADMTPYIRDPAGISLRDLHEDWWKTP